MTASSPSRVVVALKRPADYLDVHPELVVQDALRENAPWEIVGDDGSEVLVALERPEEYERVSAKSFALEYVLPSWPAWRVVKV
jgi:hypothetical protein